MLGSGLTMVDVAILLADRGHRGPILALSRHGLLPKEHAPTRRAPPSEWLDGPPTARGLLRQIRLEIARAERAGIDWRAVLDGWRERVPLLWHRLPMVERRRFLRHLRPVWDIHRHRMAPEIGCQIKEMQASGQLEVRAGTIEAYQAGQDGVAVRFRNRGSKIEVRVVGDWLVSCAGPALDFRHVREPLIQDLLARGLVRPEPLGLGLETTRGLQLVGWNGRPNGSLFALGPLTRGTFWETTGVPEIREQGRALARRLAMNGSRARRLGDARVLLARYATSCRPTATAGRTAPARVRSHRQASCRRAPRWSADACARTRAGSRRPLRRGNPRTGGTPSCSDTAAARAGHR